LNPEDWTTVAGSEGSTDDGKVVSSFVIDSLTLNDAGYYRLVVTPPSLNDSWYCHAASDEVEIIVKKCATVRGTVFPLIHYNYPEIDKLFPVIARLFDISLLPKGPVAIMAAEPLYVDTALYYDGSVFIPNTPKFPGYLGVLNNPGLPINWRAMGYNPNEPDTTPVLRGETPRTPIGMFKFEKVEPNDYILVLTKGGYVTRFAKIRVEEQEQFLGHRELIAGDLNGDLMVDMSDISNMRTKIAYYGEATYNPWYDINGDLSVSMTDVSLVNFYLNFYCIYYLDTEACFSAYKSIMDALRQTMQHNQYNKY